jgi:carbonic anhydrase/acetyltransferase-like protein (isoleucine patch superfamily)
MRNVRAHEPEHGIIYRIRAKLGNQMKKYELTSWTKTIEYGAVLYRIRALKAFGDVKAGDYGGWVSGEYNLSQDGECWVYDEAQVSSSALVCDNARVCGNAQVYDDAMVSDNARVSDNAQAYDHAKVRGNARVYGEAHVSDNARVYGDAQVYGDATVSSDAWVSGDAKVRDNAQVYGDAWVFGDAQVSDNAQVCGKARVCGFAKVHGKAMISQTNDILTIGAIGSGERWTTIFKEANIGVRVSCGSFTGSLDEFAAKVRETHGNNTLVQEYNALIALARIRFADALGGGSNEKV